MKRSRTSAVGLSSVGSSSCWTLDCIAIHSWELFRSFWCCIPCGDKIKISKLRVNTLNNGKNHMHPSDLSWSPQGVLPLFPDLPKNIPRNPNNPIKIAKTTIKTIEKPVEIYRTSRRTAVSFWASARGGTTSLPCAAVSRPSPTRRIRIPRDPCSGPGPLATVWPARSGRRCPSRRGAVSSWPWENWWRKMEKTRWKKPAFTFLLLFADVSVF